MSYFPSLAFLTDNAGAGEWIVLFVVILIVVGPKKLPEVVRKIGRTMEMFRRAADEFKDQLMSMDQETHTPSAPSSAAPKTDVDGVPNPDAAHHSETSGSYDQAYPNMADYPGNEGHVENWASDASQEHHATDVPPQHDAGAAAGQPPPGSGETAVTHAAPPAADSAKGKPAEEKA